MSLARLGYRPPRRWKGHRLCTVALPIGSPRGPTPRDRGERSTEIAPPTIPPYYRFLEELAAGGMGGRPNQA